MSDLIWNRARNPVARLVLAHGAGAPMDSEFMNVMAASLSDQGITVVRFEFPYMARRREEQRKFPPNRAPQLLQHFRQVLAALPEDRLPTWIGGNPWAGEWLHCWLPNRIVLLFAVWRRLAIRFILRVNRRRPAPHIYRI